MKLFPTTPQNDNEVSPFEQSQMFSHGLSGHIEVPTEFTQGLAVVAVQLIEQSAAAGTSERLEDFIHRENMQPNGCMSNPATCPRILARPETHLGPSVRGYFFK